MRYDHSRRYCSSAVLGSQFDRGFQCEKHSRSPPGCKTQADVKTTFVCSAKSAPSICEKAG